MTRGSACGGLVMLLLLSSSCYRVSNSQFSGDCSLEQCRRPVERYTQDTPIGLTACTTSCIDDPLEAPLLQPGSTEDNYTIIVDDTPGSEDFNLLLKIEVISENITHYEELTQNSLSLADFACTEILLSYAWINDSEYTEFSPSSMWCLSNGVAGPPTDIVYTVTGDCTWPSIDHITIMLNWTNPSAAGGATVDGFDMELTLSANETRDHCIREGLPYRATITTNSLLIMAENETSHPFLNCDYAVNIITMPGGYGDNVAITKGPAEPSIMYIFSHVYDPRSVTYNITLQWRVELDCTSNIEIDRIEVKLETVVGNNPLRTLVDRQDLYPNLVGGDSRDFEIIFAMQSPLVTEKYTYAITVFGVRTSNLQAIGGTLAAPPMPPTTLTNISLVHFIVSNARRMNISIEWDPPQFANGNLIEYQIWIGGIDLATDNTGPIAASGIDFIYTSTIPSDTTSLVATDIQLNRAVNNIYIQVRSKNCDEIRCVSNWSLPLTRTVADRQQMTTPITMTTPQDPVTMTTQGPLITNELTNKPSIPSFLLWTLVGTSVGIVILMVTIGVVVVYCCYDGRCAKKDIAMAPMLSLESKDSLHIFKYMEPEDDGWEIPRDFLNVQENKLLGSGCFGEVMSGTIHIHYIQTKKRLAHQHSLHLKSSSTPDSIPVAIKKLKQNAEGKERNDFLKEIETMKRVSSTKDELRRFVVNMIGCCRTMEPILLVIEFVKHGDLLTYLRNMKKKATEDDSATEPVPYLEPVGVYSKLEEKQRIDKENGLLTETNLLNFARQVAAGMEYLTGLNIVHRDLACRNILIGENREVKISDFGLSRVVPQDEVYTLTNHGRLPIRWMAPESIFQREFTSASDVWSYGIALWEICTMGAFPYSTINEKELLKMLKKGFRLEKPSNCSNEIYEVMHQCWHPDTRGRPSFSDLHKLFDYFLMKQTQDHTPYIDMEATLPYTFDHLAPKTITEYQQQQQQEEEPVLNIDDQAYPEGESGYNSPQDEIDSGELKPEINRYIESDAIYTSDVKNDNSKTGPSHISLHRLHSNDNDMPYDHLRNNSEIEFSDVSDPSPAVAIPLLPLPQYLPLPYDCYPDLWIKKLSTITEASFEDYEDM